MTQEIPNRSITCRLTNAADVKIKVSVISETRDGDIFWVTFWRVDLKKRDNYLEHQITQALITAKLHLTKTHVIVTNILIITEVINLGTYLYSIDKGICCLNYCSTVFGKLPLEQFNWRIRNTILFVNVKLIEKIQFSCPEISGKASIINKSLKQSMFLFLFNIRINFKVWWMLLRSKQPLFYNQ